MEREGYKVNDQDFVNEAANTEILGIAVVNYFSHDSIAILLKSLRTFALNVTTIVSIVDNSQDEGRQEYEQLISLSLHMTTDNFKIIVTPAPTNLGYGAGNNLAVTRLIDLNVSLLWILNPDTRVVGSAKQLLREAFTSEFSVWSTTTIEHGIRASGLGKINTLTGQAGPTTRSDIGMRRLSFEYPGGHSILFSTDSWHRVQGFDEDYFLFMEEADLAMRCRSLGIRIGTLRGVSVHHDQGLTTGSSSDIASKSIVAFREATKSRVIFFRKHYPMRLPLLICSRLAYMTVAGSKGNSSGAKAIFGGIVSGLRKAIATKGINHD